MKKKMIAFLLCVLMLSAVLPTGILAENEYPPMQNVKLSADGILSWDAFPGAEDYNIRVGTKNGYTSHTSIDLKEVCMTNGMQSGTYSVEIWAAAGGKIVSSYTSVEKRFTYTAPYSKLGTPKNLRWDKNIARWDPVDGADYYLLRWYKNGKYLGEQKFENCFCDNEWFLRQLIIGSTYKFDVWAVSTKGHPAGDKATSPEMLYHEYGTITNVEITGVKEPVVGESTAIKASDLTLVSSPAFTCTIGSAQWYNGTDGTSADTTFKAGCEYYLIVTLTPADGCNFKWGSSGLTYSGKATINGVNARMKIRTSLTAKNLKIYSEYYTPAPCKHTSTEVRNAKAATCTAEGYSGDTYCKTCGEVVESGHSVAKIAHKESDWITDKAAAVGVAGSKHKECTVCHTVLKTEAIPALEAVCKHDHLITRDQKDATCTAEGFTGDLYCNDCGALVSEGKKIEKTGHDYHDGVCTRCGAIDPDYKPAETEPAETEPAETKPTETKPTETEPTGTEPTATGPSVTDPAGTDAIGTDVPGTEPAGETEKPASLLWLWILLALLAGAGSAVAVMKLTGKKERNESRK